VDRRASRLNDDDKVVSLGVDPPPEQPEPTRPMSRLHSMAVATTALFAALSVASALAFVTVNWSGTSRRCVIAIALLSVVGFLAGVAITVFSAARDTYTRR
jgi:hypothetical protein